MRPLIVLALLARTPDPRTDPEGVPLPPDAVARVGSARFRAGDPIGGLRFAPDGDTVFATTSYHPSVLAWDAHTGRPRWRIDYAKLTGNEYAFSRSVAVG